MAWIRVGKCSINAVLGNVSIAINHWFSGTYANFFIFELVSIFPSPAPRMSLTRIIPFLNTLKLDPVIRSIAQYAKLINLRFVGHNSVPEPKNIRDHLSYGVLFRMEVFHKLVND